MVQAVPNLRVSRNGFLKHQVGWNTVCGAIQDQQRHNILSSVNPVQVFNEHLSLLYGRYGKPRLFVCAARISLGLIISEGALVASSRRLIFGGPVIASGFTGKSCPLSSES